MNISVCLSVLTKMAITQPIFKLGPPYFACQSIQVISTEDDNDDDADDADDNDDDNDDSGDDNENLKLI